ncbi:MAG: hypothetical protein U0797_19935 [Gemmataceae bacterium]
MPGERPARRSRAKSQLKAAVKEFVRLLDAVPADKPATKLQLDIARDAGLDACGKLFKRIQKLEARVARGRQRRDAARERLLTLLAELAAGPVTFPRPLGLPEIDPDKLDQTFAQLRDRDFPALASHLRDAAGHAEAIAYERYLVEEFFLKGSSIMAEHLVRESRRPHPVQDEVEFLDKLRHHLAGNVQAALWRQAGYKVSQEVAQEIDAVLVRTLRYLLYLLTMTPPRRLILPTMGAEFDPALHQVVPGRPDSGPVVIRATIFPGCLSLESPPRVVAKAQVYTRQVGQAAAGDSAEASGGR